MMSDSVHEEKIEEQAEEANKWLASDQGRKEIDQALEETKNRIQELKEDRKVDYENLYDPIQ